MRTRDKEGGGRAGGLLLVAWLILFALVSGTVTWLYFYGEQRGPGATAAVPGIVAPIPPPAPKQTAQAPEQTPPAPTAATPPEAQASITLKVPGPPPAATPPAGPQSETPPAEAAKSETAQEGPKAPEPLKAPEPAKAEVTLPEPPKPEPPKVEAPKVETSPSEAAAKEAKPPESEAKVLESKAPEEKPAESKAAGSKPAEVKPEKHTAEKAAEKPPEKAKEIAKAEPEPAKAKEAAPGKSAPEKTQVAALPEPKLSPAPDPNLVEHGREGPLPIIGPDGREPWQVYARPFDQTDKRPRIAVVITDLGLSGAATETAIQQLPGSVSLAFSPYAKGLDQWTNLARAAGHEVLMDLPMEPIDYPEQDPGPYTLLTSIDPRQNLFKMQWLLSRTTGYVGVTNHMGSRFTTSGPDLKPVLDAIKARGLLFLDSRSSDQSIAAKMATDMGMPTTYNSRFIDAEASRDAIDSELDEVEKLAKKTGFAVAMGTAYPVTMERVAAWVPKAEQRGFAIAPVSAMVNKQIAK